MVSDKHDRQYILFKNVSVANYLGGGSNFNHVTVLLKQVSHFSWIQLINLQKPAPLRLLGNLLFIFCCVSFSYPKRTRPMAKRLVIGRVGTGYENEHIFATAMADFSKLLWLSVSKSIFDG